MDDRIQRALSRGHLIDITTTGRRTGQPRRIALVFHNIDGRLYISGMPNARRMRDWLRNLIHEPRFMFHLRGGSAVDLPATARVITEVAERRTVLEHVARNWNRTDVDFMVEHSPLIEVSIEGYAPPAVA
jgi:deazaflavin-dependent oxidoreductase (nitroreductase family)